MARKNSQVQGQTHKLSFGNLSIHDGRRSGGRDNHQSSHQDNYHRGGNHPQQESYQRSETGTERSYYSNRNGRAASGVPNQYGSMHNPQRPSDALSESGESEVSTRTVMPEDRQPQQGFSYEQMRPSRGPPSLVSNMTRHKRRNKRDASVAASETLSAIHAPPGHPDFRYVHSEADSTYGTMSEAGWPATRAQWSGHEGSAASCNMSVAGSESDWYTVNDFDTSSVVTTESDDPGRNSSWEDGFSKGLASASSKYKNEYARGYSDGHKDGVKRGLDEAHKLRRKNGS